MVLDAVVAGHAEISWARFTLPKAAKRSRLTVISFGYAFPRMQKRGRLTRVGAFDGDVCEGGGQD